MSRPVDPLRRDARRGDSLPGHAGVPDADVVIDAALAGRLLSAERPDLAGLPLAEVASGFDHVTFRLGDEFALRLPRRTLGASMLPGEQRVVPHLAPHVEALGLAVPTPVHRGAPTDDYPYPWAVVRWVDGHCLEDGALEAAEAEVVVELLASLRAAPPVDDPPRNPFRGVPLADRHQRFAARVGSPAVRRRARRGRRPSRRPRAARRGP